MPKLSNANITSSALEVWDKRAATYAVSKSSGNVKASAGILWGWMGTTGGGVFDVKDGNTSIGVFTVSAGVLVSFPFGIACLTNISLSASVGVATVFYT